MSRLAAAADFFESIVVAVISLPTLEILLGMTGYYVLRSRFANIMSILRQDPPPVAAATYGSWQEMETPAL